ncbi:hypothetical protein [Marinilactibacillus psychrotolerans]|uniref:hypothetical protein n=1 Tax=Marinilactibacillus psychrotolerans TaxID=191770 RepID=UPI0039AEEEB2
MIKDYVILLHFELGLKVPVKVKAENVELAMDYVQGMIKSEEDGWVRIQDFLGTPIRFKETKLLFMSVDNQFLVKEGAENE